MDKSYNKYDMNMQTTVDELSACLVGLNLRPQIAGDGAQMILNCLQATLSH